MNSPTPRQSAPAPRPPTPRQSVLAPPRISSALHQDKNIPAGASTLWPGVVVWGIVGGCCCAPVLWIVAELLLNPSTWHEAHLDSFRAALIARTLIYNGAVAIAATALAVPAAIVIGRGRGVIAAAIAFLLPISLLLPSLTFAYGWKQFIRLLGYDFAATGFADVSRCVWSLATWLYPVPAIVMGLSLRRVDASLQQQALLDGRLWTVTARQIMGPAIASMAIVAVLAMQEFAVYEPTGISVIATETRMVFETGAFSSPDNPITQPMTGAAATPAPGMPGEGRGEGGVSSEPTTHNSQGRTLSPTLSLSTGRGSEDDQRARAAAAVAVSLPLLLVVAALSIVALLAARQFSAAEAIDAGPWPRTLDARWRIQLLACVVLIVALGAPIRALIRSRRRPFDLPFVWGEFGPAISGSILVASVAGIFALLLALGAIVRRRPAATIVALLSFLIGGQLLAIALIRLYNHRASAVVYQSAFPAVAAYIARFGWIALLAAGATWSAPWRPLRDVAAVDGASAIDTARNIIWPLAWPILAASALLVATLSLSEVPATVLLSPQRPQMLVPLLMTWVHLLRFDPMIEASLLMAAIIFAAGTVAAALAWYGWRRGRRAAAIYKSTLVLAASILIAGGCDRAPTPDAIWLSTGIGPGHVVYPRAIAYSPGDDTLFVIDRSAHVQHLSHDGEFLNDWHMPLSQQGKPVGVSVGPDGNVYVPDTHYHRVMVYSPDGQLLRQWGHQGMSPGEFIYPTDIAFDSKGNIFVSEYGDNDRIQAFDRDGKFLYAFGKFGNGPGEFSRPQSMVIDGDVVYVTDACNHRIAVFKTDGTFVRNMGRVGSAPGEFRFPYGMDMDKDGDLIVCEFGNARVQKIDKQKGAAKKLWGAPGREPGQFAYPWGVAVDKRNRIIAVDAGNNRLQVFQF